MVEPIIECLKEIKVCDCVNSEQLCQTGQLFCYTAGTAEQGGPAGVERAPQYF